VPRSHHVSGSAIHRDSIVHISTRGGSAISSTSHPVEGVEHSEERGSRSGGLRLRVEKRNRRNIELAHNDLRRAGKLDRECLRGGVVEPALRLTDQGIGLRLVLLK
jgi:hypothetical protein